MIDTQIQALLVMHFSQVSGEMEEFSSICKLWKCTWPGQRVSIASSWGCLGFQTQIKGIAHQLSASPGTQPTLHTHLLFCKLPNACLHAKKSLLYSFQLKYLWVVENYQFKHPTMAMQRGELEV